MRQKIDPDQKIVNVPKFETRAVKLFYGGLGDLHDAAFLG
jgi:hypothetical protein